MKPITFTCRATVPQAPEQITAKILDVSKWTEFKGCWPIPGIQSATFEVRTPEVVGSRIRVVSDDCSTHLEEIVEWDASRRVRMLMSEFSAPLSRFASEFEETFEFQPVTDGTRVLRSFRLYPRSFVARFGLRVIAFFVKRAINSDLRRMAKN